MKVIKFLFGAGLLVLLALVAIFIYIDLGQETAVIDEEVNRDVQGQYVDLSQGKTRYKLSYESDEELVVLIHGGGISGIHVWEKSWNALNEAGYSVLAYDLYGRGYSDRPEVEYTPELMLAQLEELLEASEISQKIHLVSLSLGAMVAVDFTVKHPDRVKSLVFIDPILQGNYRPNPLLYVPVLSNFIMTTYWYPRAVENQRKEFVNMQKFEDYSVHLNYYMNFDGYKRVNYSTWMHTLQVNYMPVLEKMNVSNMKTLLVYGDSDPYFPTRSVEAYSATLPGTQFAGSGSNRAYASL